MTRRAHVPAALVLGALVLTGAGCAAPRLVGWTHGPETRPPLPEGRLAVSAPVFLADVPGAAPGGVYEDNLFVGHAHHSGGYVLAETAGGSVHRSRSTELSQTAEYRAQASRWLSGVVDEALSHTGRTRLPAPELAPAALPSPERIPHRGSHPDDGRDNLNLPRYRLAPVPLKTTADAPLLLVPWVLSYYSHNGGWFSGQTYGCGGGARIRVWWVVYDGQTGAALGSGEVDVRYLEPMELQPGQTRIEDFLIEAETEARDRLTRALADVL